MDEIFSPPPAYVSPKAIRNIEGAYLDRIKEVYNEEEYKPILKRDLRNSQALILWQCPYLSSYVIDEYRPILRENAARGVQTCIFLQLPRDRDPQERQRKLEALERQADELRSMEIHVSLLEGNHEKLVVIDNHILWDSSLNTLSHYNTKERLTRWDSEREVKAAIKKHHLDTCIECAQTELFYLFGTRTEPDKRCAAIINQLIAKRKQLRIPQHKLAAELGLHQTALSKLERGMRDTNFSHVEQISSELDLALIPCEKYMLPAVLSIMRRNKCL